MSTKHTATPWRVHIPTATEQRLLVLHPDGERVIAKCSEGFDSPSAGPIPYPEREANAARIVACVNALDGINPEAVPLLVEKVADLLAYIGPQGPCPAKCGCTLCSAQAVLALAKAAL